MSRFSESLRRTLVSFVGVAALLAGIVAIPAAPAAAARRRASWSFLRLLWGRKALGSRALAPLEKGWHRQPMRLRLLILRRLLIAAP